MSERYDFQADVERLLAELDARVQSRGGCVVIDLSVERRKREARRKRRGLPQVSGPLGECEGGPGSNE